MPVRRCARLGIEGTVEHVTDYGAIAGYGVMNTPALVVAERVGGEPAGYLRSPSRGPPGRTVEPIDATHPPDERGRPAAALAARPVPAGVDPGRDGAGARPGPARSRTSTTRSTRSRSASVSLPIALGLLVMMYPVLAKVRYSRSAEVAGDRRLLVTSLVLNWVIGPALMFALAWLLLPDLPEYRTGLIIIGLARCIAMVLIWNDLACGDREAAAVLVAINSVFQIVAYSLLGYFYLQVLPGWLGLGHDALDVSMWEIAKIVLVFLGIPLVAGFLTRRWGERAEGSSGTSRRFLPRIGPVGALRPAVHDRDPVRAPGRDDHRQAARRGPDRRAAARLLRADVGRVVRSSASGWDSATRRTPRVAFTAAVQQLRTRHRGGDRRLRGHLRRRRWPAWSGR